jgi:SAM-dependent methyltransferase
MMTASRRQFLEDYGHIRSAEGRGSAGREYYRALPFADRTGRHADQWLIRATSFRYVVRHILPNRRCDVLDLGAGNCWFSYRLAELGHSPVAVDVFTDARDGLCAARHYPTSFPLVEADFDHLPFHAAIFDLAVFNASIHYSPDYARTLSEARRCLRPGGQIIIADSPVYATQKQGERMRAERHAEFERIYGFRSDALGSLEFFDLEMLSNLSRQLSLIWTVHRPWYGLRWHTRHLRARLRRRRTPSHFWILVGRFA